MEEKLDATAFFGMGPTADIQQKIIKNKARKDRIENINIKSILDLVRVMKQSQQRIGGGLHHAMPCWQ